MTVAQKYNSFADAFKNGVIFSGLTLGEDLNGKNINTREKENHQEYDQNIAPLTNMRQAHQNNFFGVPPKSFITQEQLEL